MRYRDLDGFLPSFEKIQQQKTGDFEQTIVRQLAKAFKRPAPPKSEHILLERYTEHLGLPLRLFARRVPHQEKLDAMLEGKPERTLLYRTYCELREDNDVSGPMGLIFSWVGHGQSVILHDLETAVPGKSGRWFRAGEQNKLYRVERFQEFLQQLEL